MKETLLRDTLYGMSVVFPIVQLMNLCSMTLKYHIWKVLFSKDIVCVPPQTGSLLALLEKSMSQTVTADGTSLDQTCGYRRQNY